MARSQEQLHMLLAQLQERLALPAPRADQGRPEEGRRRWWRWWSP
jgi:hypothetical protein